MTSHHNWRYFWGKGMKMMHFLKNLNSNDNQGRVTKIVNFRTPEAEVLVLKYGHIVNMYFVTWEYSYNNS